MITEPQPNDRPFKITKSPSSGEPLEIGKYEDGSCVLWDGHHRIADEVFHIDRLVDVLNLKFDVIIFDAPYRDIQDDIDESKTPLMLFGDWVKNSKYINLFN